MKLHLAIDIGASSMRGILGRWENGKIQMQEIYRRPNEAVRRDGHLCWDPDGLFAGILETLRLCGEQHMIPYTMGIDTWAVDYVLLDGQDRILGDCVSYRDSRTDGMDRILEERISSRRCYEITGIAKQPFNTVYQLMAQFSEHPEHRNAARSFLMVPDYLGFLLTGVKRNEYTNCSTTGLLDARTRTWSREILGATDIPARLFRNAPAAPGTALGNLKPELAEKLGFDVTVLLPATHDTGSAFVAIPIKDDNAVYLSSGTWSLLGAELAQPFLGAAACDAGFTNEGGYGGKIHFLKNIMGLWMLQCVQKELGGEYTFSEMAEIAAAAEDYSGRVDVTDNRFLAPESMTAEIRAALAEGGFPAPTLPELLSCVTHSLAECYAAAIADLETLLGKTFTSVHIVGGGSQNRVLNRWTATAAGVPVYAGPSEGTALGNLMVQMIASGTFPDIREARAALRESFAIQEVLP